MNKKAFARLEKLAAQCAEFLKDPHRQSHTIFRGEMWAVIGAHHDIKKLRHKPASQDREARNGN